VAVACFIAAVHIVVVRLGMMRSSGEIHFSKEPVQPMVAEIIEAQPASFLSLNPNLAPAEIAVTLEMPNLSAEFEGAEPSLQPPMIDPEMRLDVSSYSKRAALPEGVVATVILLLGIGSDGSVTSAEVVRSNAADTANVAAVEYAKATQWRPGRVDGEARAMQASLTVILGERS
jgi:TonB family protein